MVDTVVRSVLLEVCNPQEAHHGLSWAADEYNINFCAEDVHIAGRNPILVQTTPAAVVRMFRRVELITNLGKIKAIV